MKSETSSDGGADYRKRRRLPPPNPDFAKLVVVTREALGMSQVELARTSGISPRTEAQLEAQGTARADVIILLAAALGKSPEEWLELSGHKVNRERIRDVMNARERDRAAAPFARIDPGVQFRRMVARLEKHKVGLMCSFVTSQVPIDRPDLLTLFKQMFSSGLHLALICPFPVTARNISLTRPRLGEYYGSAYKWASVLGKQLRAELPAEQRNQVSVFSPRVESGAGLVMPPLRVTELRPALIQYGWGSEGVCEYELGAYLRFLDGRPDQWIEIYGGTAPRNERTEETLGVWMDYCGDIMDGWAPGQPTHFDEQKLAFWERAPLD